MLFKKLCQPSVDKAKISCSLLISVARKLWQNLVAHVSKSAIPIWCRLLIFISDIFLNKVKKDNNMLSKLPECLF